MAVPNTPSVYLLAGHSLQGKDMVPVLKRLRALKAGPPPTELASFNKKHLLESYRETQLRVEFERITGHPLAEILDLAGVDNEMEGCRWALHAAVLHANSMAGQPAGQTLQAPAQATGAGENSAAPSGSGNEKSK